MKVLVLYITIAALLSAVFSNQFYKTDSHDGISLVLPSLPNFLKQTR